MVAETSRGGVGRPDDDRHHCACPLRLVAKVASGQEVQPFTPAFHTDDNGAIAIFGNANETCPPVQSPRVLPRHMGQRRAFATPSSRRTLSTRRALGSDTNNEEQPWHMVDVNVDPDGSRNFDSSTPPCRGPRGQACFSPACSGRAACSLMPARNPGGAKLHLMRLLRRRRHTPA